PASYSPIFDSTGHGTIRTRGKYLLQRRKTGVPVRERALLTDSAWCVRRRSPPVRPRNIRFVLCAIAERTIATRSPAARSRQIADPPVQRSIDREQRSTHGVPAVPAAAHRYDYVSIDAEVEVSRRKRDGTWRARRKEKRVIGERIHSSDPYNTIARRHTLARDFGIYYLIKRFVLILFGVDEVILEFDKRAYCCIWNYYFALKICTY
ncbi:Uncharacterized protein DBV15_10969, partial [Temnothorax longispinosus]